MGECEILKVLEMANPAAKQMFILRSFGVLFAKLLVTHKWDFVE